MAPRTRCASPKRGEADHVWRGRATLPLAPRSGGRAPRAQRGAGEGRALQILLSPGSRYALATLSRLRERGENAAYPSRQPHLLGCRGEGAKRARGTRISFKRR
jgi:hypothetical protein